MTQTSSVPKKHSGIPRTHGAAKKLGFKKSKYKFSDLSDDLKANSIKLAEAGARTGSLCGVAPSPDPGHWLVCYKNSVGQCHWVDVPKGTPIPDHE